MIAMSHADYIAKNPLFKYEYDYKLGGGVQTVGLIFRVCSILQFGVFKQRYKIKVSNERQSSGANFN